MVHEFGIMSTDPEQGRRYDTYEPKKYGCIAVHDDLVERFAPALDSVLCYWHTLDRPEKGLAYCGITLIPPQSLPLFLDAVTEIEPLRNLIHRAMAEGKFIIHYGL